MNYRIRSVIPRIFSVLLLLWATNIALAKNIPEPSGRLVNDYINLLSSSELLDLENKLISYNDSTSTQIAIVIESTLEGDDIFNYSFRIAESWGIGHRGKDNGILLYVAFDDRKLYIQTGSGTEGFLPDALAKRIIENTIVPSFRNQDYYAGLDRATTIIMELGSGEYNADDLYNNSNSDEMDTLAFIITILIFFLVFVFIVVGIRICKKRGDCGGSSGGGYNSGGGYSSGGFGGFSGGGSSSFGGGGGSFGGFGGGGFSGGGAGGGW